MEYRDHPEDQRTATSTKTTVTHRVAPGDCDLNCYFKEGFSPQFFINLRNFALYFYYHYKVAYTSFDFEEYYMAAREKVIDKIPLFDPRKGKFASYIHTRMRGVATQMTKKHGTYQKHHDGSEVYQHAEVLEAAPEQSDLHGSIDAFCQRAKDLGISGVTVRGMQHDILYRCSSPYAAAFYWLRRKGEI